MHIFRYFRLLLICTIVAIRLPAADAALRIQKPMAPPAWALLEQQLLDANSRAVNLFADRYIDERGYLKHTPRWGTLDGPDDAIETYYNWTLLYALGGSESVLHHYRRGLEGHYAQYSELRTTTTELAKNGAYHQEFITQSDWFHTGEGMRAFFMYGLADPMDPKYRVRSKRFAGLYMNEDPNAQNYDPKTKVIKSIWTGSKGPMLRKATVYDWVGDPNPGKFHLLHNPAGRKQMLDLEAHYDKMLAHCAEYLDSVGDNFLNLASTILGVNGYMLTHDPKYKNWVLEYVDAWKERTAKTGGNIPSNVGLNGEPGGEYGGQWWKGTYGWNFTIFDGELEKIAHRNYFTAASWAGFSNALLLTGDQSYVDVLRRQMDNVYANKRVENGKTLLPQMYGDPKGYKYSGRPEWYHYTDNLFTDRLTEIYMWSMKRSDLERVPKTGWIGFLEGQNPAYPEQALQESMQAVRKNVEGIRNDVTTPDTRLADYLLGLTPAEVHTLVNLMTGGYIAKGKIWMIHSRLRYFNPEKSRAGMPEGVGALVHRLTDDSVEVTLVNTDPVEPKTVVVQAGGYAEHQFLNVKAGDREVAINQPYITIRLDPGAGEKLQFTMKRYVNQPTFAQPWNRGLLAEGRVN